MTRLTFNKNETGDILTTKQFIAREKVINAHIIIKEDKFLFIINDLTSGKILSHGCTNTLAKAKKNIKLEFKQLGIIIYDELRKKL